MREFLHSEIANVHGIQSIPDHPDLAIAAGRCLCEELLEPLQAAFGRHRDPFGLSLARGERLRNAHGQSCASNERNRARQSGTGATPHGRMGAMATVVVPGWLTASRGRAWQAMAWWIHDRLPYSELQFFPKLAAFNIGWHERPSAGSSYTAPRGLLTKPGIASHDGNHSKEYPGFPELVMPRRDPAAIQTRPFSDRCGTG